MYLKEKFKLLILLLLIGIFTFSPTLFADKKELKKAKFWEKVFIDQIKNFKYYSKEIDLLVYNIQKHLNKFKSEADGYDIRYHQLKFILGSIINNPYEYRLIISELNNAERSFLKLYSEIKNLDSQAENYEKALQSMEEDLAYLVKEKYSSIKLLAAATRLTFNINILQAHLKLERKKMNNSLEDMNDLINKFTTMTDFLKESYLKQIQTYFLVPAAPLWTINISKLLPYSFESWIYTLPATLDEKFPDEIDEYIAVLIIFCISLIIYTIFHYFLIKKINIRTKVPDAYELLLRALAALFIFIGLFATSSVLIFPETVLFYRLGVIIFGFFAWFFSLALKVIQHPNKKQDSSITTLFTLFSLGIIFQVLAVNYILLALLWPMALIIALAYQFYNNLKSNSISKNAYFWVFLCLSIVFIYLSLIGYVYLSIFTCMIWFLLMVIFRIGTAFVWLLKTALEKEKYKRGFLRIILVGVGIPAIWFGLIFVVFLWAAMQINSNIYSFLDYFLDISINFGGYDFKLINIILLLFIFFIFKSTINCFTIFLSYSSYAKQAANQRHQLLPSMKTLSRYTGWIIYIIIVMAILKINITSILVILGGLSVGIGFGLQHLVNNFISGLIIMFGKACRPGDIIELDSIWGTIVKTDIRTTTMRTFDNCIITIPNSMLIDKQLHNWTKNNDLIRKDLDIGVEYGTDVEKVKRLLLETANSFDEVCKTPAPQVIFNDFGKNALIFRLRIWLYVIDNIVATPSDIRYAVNKIFKENGISIAYPQLDIHIKSNQEKTVLRSQE